MKILFKTNICTALPHYLAAAARWTPNCAQNLATFGVGTTIKSIPLTSTHHWDGSSNLELPPHIKRKVNRIDLIVVPTPKVAKFWGQLGARRADAGNQWGKVSTDIGFKEYFHMLCGLQLFVGTIPRSLMPWWVVGDVFSRVMCCCWSEGHGRVDQVASVRERQIPPTHV